MDNLNDYYSVQLKKDRLAQLDARRPRFRFHHLDLADGAAMARLFDDGAVRRRGRTWRPRPASATR